MRKLTGPPGARFSPNGTTYGINIGNNIIPKREQRLNTTLSQFGTKFGPKLKLCPLRDKSFSNSLARFKYPLKGSSTCCHGLVAFGFLISTLVPVVQEFVKVVSERRVIEIHSSTSAMFSPQYMHDASQNRKEI